MFLGAFDQPIPWSTQGARGCRRFLERVWRLQDMLSSEKGIRTEMAASVHGTIKKVGEDFERMKYNTAIAAMMSLVNEFYEKGSVTRDELHTLLLLLSPVAPHISEEINGILGNKTPLYRSPWPAFDESALVKSTAELGVQVNGKVRGRIEVSSSLDNKGIEEAALACPDVLPYVEGKTVRKVIVVRNIVNIVVSD
jgi:leucyl-tRNA synthetase